jgi:hypothetical protein
MSDITPIGMSIIEITGRRMSEADEVLGEGVNFGEVDWIAMSNW